MDALVANMVSFARSSNQAWPFFVTIPDFELRCAKTRVLSKAVVIERTHFVTSQQRIEWEAYTSQNNWWVNQSIAVQEKDPNFHGPIIYDYYTLDYIQDWPGERQRDNPFYIVLWQSSPVIPRYSPYNWDALSMMESSTLALNMLETRNTLLSRSNNLPNMDDPEEVLEHEAIVDWFQYYVSQGQDPSEPVMDIVYPIFDNTDEVTIKDPNSHPFVGVLAAMIFWRDLVKDWE